MAFEVMDMLTVIDPTKGRMQGIEWVVNTIKGKRNEENISYSPSERFNRHMMLPFLHLTQVWLDLPPQLTRFHAGL